MFSLFLSTLSHKQRDFQGKAIGHKMWVLVFFTAMSETLLILRRTKGNITTLPKYCCKVPFIHVDFSRNLVFSRKIFGKTLENKFHKKFSSCGWLVVPCGQTDEVTDRHDKANSRFSQFCKSHSNKLGVSQFICMKPTFDTMLLINQ